MGKDKKFTPSSNKAVVPTLGGESKVGFEYKPRGDGIWEITLGGKKATIKQEDLFALVFYAADVDQVDKLTPVQNTEVRIYTRVHKIKLKNNMKKGDTVTATCEISVPTVIEQGLKGILEKKKSSLIVPR